MIKMSLSTKEVNQAIKQIEKKSTQYKGNLSRVVFKGALDIESDAKSRSPVNEGRLRSGIVSKLDRKNISADVVSTADYSAFMEFGTKTKVSVPAGYDKLASQFRGSKQGKFGDLLKAISDWASKKGIDEEAVYPIALSIARKGVPAKPFLIPSYERQRPRIIQGLKKAKI